MSWRIETTESGRDIVLDGFEKGIASSPHAGIAGLVNLDVTSVPGEARVAFKTAALNKPPTVSAAAFTSDITTDRITVASTAGYYNGMAIQFNSIVTSTGITTGRVYWIGDLSGNTFKVYKNPARATAQVVDIATGNGSGTLSSYTFTQIIDHDTAYGVGSSGELNYTFILDSEGKAWIIDNFAGTNTNNLVYLGNDYNPANTDGRAIVFWKNHLIVFAGGSDDIDGVGVRALGSADMDSAYSSETTGGWEYAWETASGAGSDQNPLPVFVGQDDVLYYANGDARIGSLTEVAGDTLDLDDSTSYIKNTSALEIPDNDEIMCIDELGQMLLIGGRLNKIYPWDRSSSSFDLPILVPEKNIRRIVSTSTIAYIFAGTGSRIYYTNGSVADIFFSIPDHLTGVSRPYYTLGDVSIDKNEMYLSMSVVQNDGSTAVTGMDGVWAINLTTLALRKILTASHGTEGKVHAIIKNELSSTPPGEGLIIGWEDASGNFGMDTGSTAPYSSGEACIDFDAIPIGTVNFPTTPTMFEIKLARSLVAGESVQLLQRTQLNGSYASIGTFDADGEFSGTLKSTVKQAEWLQIRAVLTSTVSSPSFVPLREVRIKI